jgi:S-formylglutathione hydrolase FrmB
MSKVNSTFRIALAAFVFAFLISNVSAQGRIDCNAMDSRILKQPVHLCVLLPAGYDANPSQKYPVLYFLHGLGENEQALFQSGGWNVVEGLRRKHEIGDFLIVTPEAKGSFYINSADGKVRYSDFFLQEFMPYVEAKYHIRRDRSSRAIGGISMGGYGAFRYAFAHPELFSSVSAESAALITQSPAELNATMKSGGQLGRLLGAVFGNPISVSHWNDNNPFTLARRNKSTIGRLGIYFNCGKSDDFGFEDGAQAMDRQLTGEKVKHEFHLYPGNHDMDYFLSHLGELMTFHSRQFALNH